MKKSRGRILGHCRMRGENKNQKQIEANANIREHPIKMYPSKGIIGNDNAREDGGKQFPTKWTRGLVSNDFNFSLKAWSFPPKRHWALPHGNQ